jgi:hypothetical protein
MQYHQTTSCLLLSNQTNKKQRTIDLRLHELYDYASITFAIVLEYFND